MKQMWLAGTLPPNTFPLPHEVFELGLEQGVLLVYIYLIYHKCQKHSAKKLSCATISKAVSLCEKTVQRHLYTLVNNGFIQATGRDSSFSYELCSIWNKVREYSGGNLLKQCNGGQSA